VFNVIVFVLPTKRELEWRQPCKGTRHTAQHGEPKWLIVGAIKLIGASGERSNRTIGAYMHAICVCRCSACMCGVYARARARDSSHVCLVSSSGADADDVVGETRARDEPSTAEYELA